MSKVTKDLSNLSAVELRQYAKDELGVSYPATYSKAELVSKIVEASPEGSADTAPAGDAKSSDGRENERPTHVIIHVSENDDDKNNYVRVIENGVAFQIMKGKDVKVPYGVYDNLKCSVEAIPVVKKNPETGKDIVVMRERPRHAFSVIERIYANK